MSMQIHALQSQLGKHFISQYLIVESVMANGRTMKDPSFLRNWKMVFQFCYRASLRLNEHTPYFRISSTIVAYDGGKNRHCCQGLRLLTATSGTLFGFSL